MILKRYQSVPSSQQEDGKFEQNTFCGKRKINGPITIIRSKYEGILIVKLKTVNIFGDPKK